jgi:serine/threonine-protein kinase RsbW
MHGNKGNPDKNISVILQFNPEKFTLTIQDEGDGFDVSTFSQQLMANQLEIPTKRGLFIVKYLTDEISFNNKGNEITATMYLNDKRPVPEDN